MQNALRSTLDLVKLKSNPHADGTMGSTQTKAANLTTSQMKKNSIHQTRDGIAYGSTTPTTQYFNVHFLKTKTWKAPQQPGENKKGKGKKGSGGNNKKYDKNVEGAKDEKRKVKFPCNICEEDHLTHYFPQMEESQHLIKLKQQH